MKLTKEQNRDIWGDGGPYSEARIKIEARILDDKVSRTFIVVEKARKHFKYDKITSYILDNSRYSGVVDDFFGYIADLFTKEYVDESVLDEARVYLEQANDATIKMHEFVIDLLELER